MIEVKSLTHCTFDELLIVWNQGFQGYPVDVSNTMDNLVARFGRDGLSAELSMVAWIDGRPVGFILNGSRRVRDKHIAWNGGTGVIPEYRRTGVGHRLVEACMEVYRANGIEVAFLESLAQNTAAIALYQQHGYRIIDQVAVMARGGVLPEGAFPKQEICSDTCTLVRGPASNVASLPFYNAFGPWQTQWMNIHRGQSIILKDIGGVPLGYALFNEQTNDNGDIAATGLFQCETAEDLESPEPVIHMLLREIYGPIHYSCKRTGSNISCANQLVIEALRSAGFSEVARQVVMMCEIGE